MMRILKGAVLLGLLLPIFTWAQTPERIYQLSGLIISDQGEQPIPYVSIQINQSRRGTFSSEDGFYSIPVTKNDTLYFTSVGYYGLRFVVADYLREYRRENATYLYAIHYMLEDSFSLPEVLIFPYDTPEELRTAFVNLESQGTPEAIARANLNPDVIDAIIQTLPVDGEERLVVGRQMYYDYYQNKQLIPTAGLDPVAALRVLQYIADRARRKRDRDLNYWE